MVPVKSIVVAFKVVVPVAPGLADPRFPHVIVLPERLKLLKRAEAPVAPPIVIFPLPAFKVKFLPETSPFRVPVMSISPPTPPPVVSVIALFAIWTFPLNVMALPAPEIVMFPPTWVAPVYVTVVAVCRVLLWTIVAPVAAKQCKGVMDPMGPLNWIAPVPAFRVKQ